MLKEQPTDDHEVIKLACKVRPIIRDILNKDTEWNRDWDKITKGSYKQGLMQQLPMLLERCPIIKKRLQKEEKQVDKELDEMAQVMHKLKKEKVDFA